ncbi:MAG: hypothetical protein J5762_06955 [Clostridia bacterium]|nr:hypothetical protein [Clostridia bacterium]
MKRILKRDALWFVLVFTASAIIWNLVFSALNEPKATEKLGIFIVAAECDENYFHDKLKSVDGVKKTYVYNRDENQSYFDEYFGTAGMINSDLILLPEDMLSDAATLACLTPFTDEIISLYSLENCVFAEIDGAKYGVIVKDDKTDIFGDAITFSSPEKNYVLAVNNSSPNAVINENDKAFKALSALLPKT